MEVKKFDNISLIKVVMMILVVLYHSLLFFGNRWFYAGRVVYPSDILFKLALWLNTFHINAFVMASGFLFYYSKERNKDRSTKENIIKKVKRLIIPYYCIGLLWVVPIKLVLEKVNMLNYMKKFILGVASDQLWFLYMLFIIFVIFEFLYKKITISRSNLLLSIIVFTLQFCLYEHYGIYYFQVHNVCKFIPFFYLGGYLYTNLDKYECNSKQLGILFLVAFLSLILLLINNALLRQFSLQVFSICEVILIYMLFDNIIKKYKDITSNKIYLFLEKYSFEIYLFHQQIVFLCIVLLNGRVYPLIQVILTTLISIGISILITFLLLGSKLTRSMMGMND